MGFLRMVVAGVIASAVTVALFILMGWLIETEFAPPSEDITPAISIVITPQMVDAEPTIRTPPERPQQQDPPPPPATPTRDPTLPPGPSIEPPAPPETGPNDGLGPIINVLEPMIRIALRYPDRCAQQGVEGDVLVEFDLAPDGNVVSPRILSSDPGGCLDRASLRAVGEWRYPPDDDGRIRRNVRVVLNYRLDG